jgi:putative hydrolase of the HAD superfamily
VKNVKGAAFGAIGEDVAVCYDFRMVSPHSPYTAVLFDAVGTLIRPWPSVGSVYAGAAASAGLSCGAAALERHFRRAYHDLMPKRFAGGKQYRTSESRERSWWKAAAAKTFERAGCQRPPRQVVEAAFSAFAHAGSWKKYADAERTLGKLRSMGLVLGVVSNFDARLHAVLEGLSLTDFFSSVVVSSECGFAKPSPRIYRAALRDLGEAPETTLFVGDRFAQDYQGPRSAGLEALWLVRRGGRCEKHVIRSLDRLPVLMSARGKKSGSTRPRRGGPAGPPRR